MKGSQCEACSQGPKINDTTHARISCVNINFTLRVEPKLADGLNF